MIDQKRKAQQFVDMLLQPRGLYRPDKAQVTANLGLFGEDAADPEYESESFVCRNEDVEIFGDFFPVPQSDTCVIMAHGFAQNRYILLPQLRMFHEMGYQALWFDQRAFGVSRERYGTFGLKEGADVACLAKWAKKRCGENTKIIFFGVSMGAASVMNALQFTDLADGVIEDCGFADISYGLADICKNMNNGEENPYILETYEEQMRERHLSAHDNCPWRSVQQSKSPICVIHGKNDTLISVTNAEKIYEKSSHPLSRLELFDDAEHALCVNQKERYGNILADFIQKVGHAVETEGK